MLNQKIQKFLNNRRLKEGVILSFLLIIFGWFFFRNLAMWPDPNDPLEYIEPSVWKTFIGGYYPWIDRLVIADGIRFFSLILRPELAGAVYFGLVSFLILILATLWAYLKKGFWSGFLVGLFLVISYPLVRYANYGYPDATVALFGLLAAIFYLRTKKSPGSIYLVGLFTGLAIFSKITGLAFFLFFLGDIIAAKKYVDLKPYFVGLISAVAFILIATGLLFDWASVSSVIHSIGTNVSSNVESRAVLRSVGNILWPEICLPAYLALIVFRGAYRNELITKIFSISWTFIGFFLVLFVFSTHVKVYPHYLYSAYLFASIGMTFYLAELSKSFKKQYLVSLISLILIVAGFSLGIWQARYFEGLKIYFDGFTHLVAPLWLKITYIGFTVLAAAMILAIGKTRRQSLIIAFIIFSSLSGSYFVAGSAMYTIKSQKDAAKVVYDYAHAISETPRVKTVIVSKAINRESFPRVLWVYRLFFDHKYDRGSRVINKAETDADIRQIDKADLGSFQWDYLITDDQNAVKFDIPNLREIQQPSPQIFIFSKDVPKS